jgi:hypothetical protein
MATLSGKDGKLKLGATTIADVTSWILETRSQNHAYASSSTSGYRRRVAGVRDGGGRIDFKLDFADPITDDFDVGSQVTLLLHLDATRFYSVPAVIDVLRFEVDVDTGDVIGGRAEFSTNGAWTKPVYV